MIYKGKQNLVGNMETCQTYDGTRLISIKNENDIWMNVNMWQKLIYDDDDDDDDALLIHV